MDDSHGVGVLGETGRGTVEHFGLLGEVDVITGTLGKALGGAAGGYVAASEEVCDVLAQRSRPQLFSNALPPTVACSALRSIELMLEQPELLRRLRENARVFRVLLAEAGYAPLDGEAAIVPIIVGETSQAMALSARLLDEGVFVTGFGFPVVPEGTARIRVQMSAALGRSTSTARSTPSAACALRPDRPRQRTRSGDLRDRNPRVMRISICAYLERGTRSQVTRDECAAMDNWPVNIIGLGLLVAGVLFMYFLNFVGIIIGMILIIGGIVALWMTYRRKKYPATGA